MHQIQQGYWISRMELLQIKFVFDSKRKLSVKEQELKEKMEALL